MSRDQVERLVVAFRKVLQEFYGNNAQKSESYGRIVNTRHFDRLKRMLDGCDKNLIVIGGEADREDLFIAPTVISPVSPDDPNLMQDEIFGNKGDLTARLGAGCVTPSCCIRSSAADCARQGHGRSRQDYQFQVWFYGHSKLEQ